MVHWIDQSFVHYSQIEMAKLNKEFVQDKKITSSFCFFVKLSSIL